MTTAYVTQNLLRCPNNEFSSRNGATRRTHASAGKHQRDQSVSEVTSANLKPQVLCFNQQDHLSTKYSERNAVLLNRLLQVAPPLFTSTFTYLEKQTKLVPFNCEVCSIYLPFGGNRAVWRSLPVFRSLTTGLLLVFHLCP